MSITKYTSGSWATIPYRKYETATDTITTFPKQIIGDGQSASAVIKGNLSQSGTPTPASPIYPSETGDLVASGEHSGQYKILISSASTTTPVYLGEVESTRQIRKYEFTGQENFNTYSTIGQYSYTLNTTVVSKTGICSHYILKPEYGGAKPYIRIASNSIWFELDATGYSSTEALLADFKSYLQQQYSNGTPVTVWYVLATPTTGIVNEPIRKIGTYADSVSVTGIPTTGTTESFDIDTTLKPFEVDLTYHGWHEHSDTKF